MQHVAPADCCFNSVLSADKYTDKLAPLLHTQLHSESLNIMNVFYSPLALLTCRLT